MDLHGNQLRRAVRQQRPKVVDAIRKILAACKRHNIIAGLHNNTVAYAQKMINDGFQFVTIASDSRFLAAKASEEVAALRKSGVKTGRLPAY